jgi:hypothetical protein
MSNNVIAPSVTRNPNPYRVRFFFGLPLSMNRNTRLEKRLIKIKASKIRMAVFNTALLKHI